MKIFVDAMGGDYAPDAVVAGVRLAAKETTAQLVVLGTKEALSPFQSKLRDLDCEIIYCSETIDMGESPVQAVRSKKDSSIVRGLRLSAETPNSAFFSAGHSGAVFAAALMTMGRLKGVERPAIVATLPSRTGHFLLLDAGANVDCRPNHLHEFAVMGSTYARIYLNHDKPTVGLLSNGEEDSKGTDLTRSAATLLREDPEVNFIGYVEGKEIFNGKVDVVVTDGFTGNVVLKSLEGLGKTVSSLIRAELSRGMLSKFGALISMPALRKVQNKLDYAEVGAAPLLGVDGNCFIGHGRSNARAIKNGILRAQEAIERKLHAQLSEQFKALARQADAQA